MKKLLFTFMIALALGACNNANQTASDNEENKQAVPQEEVAVMTVDELLPQIDGLVGREVVVAGDVDHVCKHGGTKMVILGDSSDIHIKATDESGNFRADEVMDHRVIVTGVVDEFRVDEDYIAQKEAELEELKANASGEETEEAEDEHDEKGMFPDNDTKHKKQIAGLEKQINGLKKMLEEAKAEGKDHVSFYSVKAETYVIDEDVEVKSEAKAFNDSPAEVADEQQPTKEENE